MRRSQGQELKDAMQEAKDELEDLRGSMVATLEPGVLKEGSISWKERESVCDRMERLTMEIAVEGWKERAARRIARRALTSAGEGFTGSSMEASGERMIYNKVAWGQFSDWYTRPRSNSGEPMVHWWSHAEGEEVRPGEQVTWSRMD